MTPQRNGGEEQNGRIIIPEKLVPIIMLVLLGGASGLSGYSAWKTNEIASYPDARPDPWTGTDARRQAQELRAEINAKDAVLRVQIADIEHRVDSLESRCAVVTDRIERILKILEHMQK